MDSVLGRFASEFEFCWGCGVWEFSRRTLGVDYPRHLETHHIIRGPGRKNDRRNLARLCKLCHDLHHGAVIRVHAKPLPTLLLSHVLWLKSRHDGPLDRQYLSTLRPKALPRAARPSEWFLRQYHSWHRNYPGDSIV